MINLRGTPIYFLPISSNRHWLFITAAALITLIAVVTTGGIAAITRRYRVALPHPPASLSRLRALAGMALFAWVLAVVSAALVLPSGPLFESLTLRVLLTSLILLIAAATMTLVVLTVGIWRDVSTSPAARIQAAVVSFASLAAVCAGLIFWVPVAWRSSDRGIERLAMRLHDAGISVQTTLVAYDAIGGPGRLRLTEDPAVDYLRADLRARWRRGGQAGPPGYRYTGFMKKVAGAMHRAGVPLMAGTDAMGLALIAPGSSLHHELELLTESGLTPYEAMRAATIVPASFLGKEKEFGTIAIGKRADLLLVDGNPLQDVTHLRHPVGVMARGKWFTRERLRQMLAALALEK